MNKDNNHSINSTSILRASLFGLLLFVILVYLSPLTTHFYLLGRGVFYLTGLAGYCLIGPFLVVLLIATMAHGRWPKGWATRLSLGYLLLLLGASTLWAYFGNNHLVGTDLSSFNTNFSNLKTGQELFTSSFLGGGIVGYLLAGTFSLVGASFVYLFAVILILGGLLICFWPLLKRAYQKIKNFMVIRASQKASAKKEAQDREEEEAIRQREINNQPLNNPDEPFAPNDNKDYRPELSSPEFVQEEALHEQSRPLFTSAAPKKVMEEEEDNTPSSTRLDLYSEKPSNLPPTNIESPYSPSFDDLSNPQVYNPGLQEATFISPSSPSKPTNPRPTYKAETSPSLMENVAPVSSIKPQVAPSIKPSVQLDQNVAVAPKVEASTPAIQTEPIPTPEVRNVEPKVVDVPQQNVEPVISTPVKETQNSEEVISLVEEEKVEAPAPSVEPVKETSPVSKSLDPNAQPAAHPLPNYIFPSTDLLLTYPDNGNSAKLAQECEERKNFINSVLNDFGVGAQVASYTIGPSVTRYNIKTDKDVSVLAIDKYIQDISVRLGGVPTRYERMVMGSDMSGLEIANKVQTMVSLKEIIEHLPPLTPKTNLYIPFGKSISGDYISSDLSDFPHMLISGSTGSGKSVFMQGMIMSLIMRNRPEDLKLVMVDPKRVEMSVYRDLPHLLCPIIKEPVQAKVCFEKLIGEMERRYTLFENSGVRSIREFNNGYAPTHNLEKLPFIVVIVDEFADLADSCKNIGDSVVRIAQKARAAGIHLVIATQRPTVDVITGTIKANLPTRVALSVASSQDSVTIIGQGGAEELAGHGDMLVDCSQVVRNGLIRCQGCFVDTKEINAVTDFIRSQSGTQYDQRFLDLVDHEEEQKAMEDSGPSRAEIKEAAGENFYELVKETIMQNEYTSISSIQRQFGIGFPRAGKIFNRLQVDGIVASKPDSASSSKGCRVLVHEEKAPSTNPGSTDQSTLGLS
jgi:DNA segregation ATPase FtsK/SpoIIIE-like protein